MREVDRLFAQCLSRAHQLPAYGAEFNGLNRRCTNSVLIESGE